MKANKIIDLIFISVSQDVWEVQTSHYFKNKM